MRTLTIQSLPPKSEWIDRDQIMLHACFQILEDCVEKEKVDTQCNYESHKEFVDEVRFLYQWWKNRKVNEPSLAEELDHQYQEDDNMLIRLIKIRGGLWT